MPVDTSVIGQVSARRVVAVERAPVSVFAKALKDRSPIYRDAREAAAAGFESIPAPPTFPFAMPFWGEYPELQDGLEPVGANPMWEVMGKLGPGLILHGEQEFEYTRPVMVGDVLEAEDVLSDVYERETETHVMTFVVTESKWKVRGTAEHVVTARFNLVHRARKPAP